MTEAEWLTGIDPVPMMKLLRNKISNRKVRLFLVASARLVWDRVPEGEMRQAIQAAEQHADGLVTAEVIREYYNRFYRYLLPGTTTEEANWYRVPGNRLILAFARMANYPETFFPTLTSNTNWTDVIKAEHSSLPPLIRDIFGNPFRPVTFSPGWRTSTAVALAQGMYDARDFSAMPILADALQDAGCDSGEVLDHCRGPGPHVRGCWVVDLVLGKE